MSRSRAMRRIRQAMNHQIEDIQPDHPLLTRRDLLKVTGLALGGALIGASLRADSFPRLASPRIGIVGAGIAGLVAALSLQDSGVNSTVYESSGRIGGRMHSNHTFWRDGQTSEWCGEFIDTVDHTIRSLAARFGFTLLDVNAAEPRGSVDTNYFLGGYYTDAELNRDMKRITPILVEQNQAIGPTAVYNNYTPAGYYFDHLSAHDWIETYVPGGHGSRLGQYLDVATVTENGLDSAQQSSLNLIFPLDSDERFHIQNGNQQLPVAIAASLPQGTVRLGWRLAAIAADGDGKVTLTFSTASGAHSEVFDYVILGLPFSVLRGLDYSRAGFDSLKQQAIQQLGYGTNSKLYCSSTIVTGTGMAHGQASAMVSLKPISPFRAPGIAAEPNRGATAYSPTIQAERKAPLTGRQVRTPRAAVLRSLPATRSNSSTNSTWYGRV